jgi:hypothetical protein
MQCASSITIKPGRRPTSGITLSANSGLANRSGETRTRSTASAVTAVVSSLTVVADDELTVIVRNPRRAAASIWLRMSANNGEISNVGPRPRRRRR